MSTISNNSNNNDDDSCVNKINNNYGYCNLTISGSWDALVLDRFSSWTKPSSLVFLSAFPFIIPAEIFLLKLYQLKKFDSVCSTFLKAFLVCLYVLVISVIPNFIFMCLWGCFCIVMSFAVKYNNVLEI